MRRVAHLTSAHPRFDTRIFLKMCGSLRKNGYDVFLVVADGQGDSFADGVNICDVGEVPGNRFVRMTKTVKKVFLKAKSLDADLYHLHDPELMFIGLQLKALGKKVIFDSHEDLPKQILGKYYLHPIFRRPLSSVFLLLERTLYPWFDAVVAATPAIRDKFAVINKRSVDINNYPILGELGEVDGLSSWSTRRAEVCYVGVAVKLRGIQELVQALELSKKVRMNFAGSFPDPKFEVETKGSVGWARVIDHGFLGRNEVREIMSRSIAGLVAFHDSPNHVDAQPNKMFEYMSAGLPVISSNFPLWASVINGNNCGICIDPTDPNQISKAINTLVDNPELARELGENGRKAVISKYNWRVEEQKLLELYEELIE